MRGAELAKLTPLEAWALARWLRLPCEAGAALPAAPARLGPRNCGARHCAYLIVWIMLKLLTLEDFAPHLNSTFTASLNDGNTEFVLVEARPLPQPPRVDAWRVPFSLLFRSGAAVLFPQQTYMVRHSTIGEFALFMVPIAQERDGFIYQAVFN